MDLFGKKKRELAKKAAEKKNRAHEAIHGSAHGKPVEGAWHIPTKQ